MQVSKLFFAVLLLASSNISLAMDRDEQQKEERNDAFSTYLRITEMGQLTLYEEVTEPIRSATSSLRITEMGQFTFYEHATEPVRLATSNLRITEMGQFTLYESVVLAILRRSGDKVSDY